MSNQLTRIEREARQYLFADNPQKRMLQSSNDREVHAYTYGALAEITRAAPLLKALADARDNIQWMLDNLAPIYQLGQTDLPVREDTIFFEPASFRFP